MNSLQAIFCQIQTFYETIQPVLVGRDVMIEDDIMEYLKTAIVCFEKEHVLNVKNIAPASHSSHQQVFKIKKIVDRVIASLLSTPDHVLCTGYRLWTGKPNVAKLNHRIECFYPNPMVNHIKDREWERIAEIIGEEATIYLLRNSSIFLPSKNVLFINKGCYYQICGVAIDKRVGNTLEPTVKDPLAVGLKRSMSTNSIPAKRQKVGMIPWSHILYGKPVYSEDGKIIVSLPPKHMLHSCSPQDLLISVFQEKPKKVHWRVKQAIPLIKRFIKNHQNCSYQALLDYYCPLTPTSRISEDSNILELDTPHHQIQGFIKAVLKRVIPVDFFGTKSNLEQFLKNICLLSTLRRYESLSCKSLLENIKVSLIDWMKSKRATSATPADAIKKTQLLSHLLYWITHDYILPLIGVCFTNKANFYITETGLHKYKLFFFRHKIWTRINSPLFQDIMQNMYEQVEESVVKQAQTGYNVLGVASMRLLPKQNGARPIVNLSKKQLLRPNYKNSVNGLLKNVFHILAMEKKRKSDLFGSAAIGKNDIYNMLKAYKQRMIPQMATAKTKFYFCKVDIQGCFNTIDQKILMDLLEKLVGEMEYAVHRFSTVQLNQGNARKKYNRVAISTDDYFQLEQLIETYVQEMRNTVFVDSTSNPYEQRASIFKLLQQHVYQHTIKVGRKYYKQKIGIPQGSVLSTLLCSLYYGYLEQTELANVTNDRNSLLIRYIDDFLFISTDKNRVKKFATMMHQGFPQFGVQVTSNKSLVNFNFSIGGESIQNVKDNELLNIGGSVLFPWCGLLIDIAHLDVLHDFTRITETDIKNSLTVEMNIHPGLALLVKTKQFLKNLAHPIYLDRSFARDEIIMRNIYQSFLFCALKFGATVDMAFKHLNPKFLLSVVKEAIAFQLELLRTRVANTKPVCSTRMVSFLGYHAFATILQKKHNKYGNVIKKIRQEMSTYPKPISVLAQSICQPEFHVYLLDIRF